MATVAKSTRRTTITLASDSAGPFDLDFRLFDDDDITVYVNKVVSEDFTLSSSYTDGYDDSATITFGTALESGDEIIIDSSITPGRGEDLIAGDNLLASMNIELGRIQATLSDHHRDIARSVRMFDAVAPAELTSGSVLMFQGGAIIEGPSAADIIVAETYADAASDAKDAAETAQAAAEAAQAAAETAFDNFTDRYLGEKTSDPTLDNDGDPLVDGALYFNTTENGMRVYDLGTTTWLPFAGGALLAVNNLSDLHSASGARTNLGLGGAATKGFSDDETLADAAADEAVSERAAKAYADAVASPDVEIARINLSNQATAEFDGTDFDNATYDSYTVRFINVIPATDGAYLRFRSSSDGGTTFDSGASDYRVTVKGYGSDGLAADFADQNIDYGVLAKWNCGNAAGEPGLSGELKIFGPGDAVYTLFRAAVGTITAAGDAQVSDATTVRLSAADVDGLQFYFSSGNLQSGTIVLIGHKGA